jgi:hypothetical protein
MIEEQRGKGRQPEIIEEFTIMTARGAAMQWRPPLE